MFGPFSYQSRPVGMSLHVVKLPNDQSANLGPMLSSLASLAQQGSISPDANAILSTLGTNLLKGFEVRLLRYDTQLVADSAEDQSLGIPKFYYGDYIVARREDRTKDIPFGEYFYDLNTAKLFSDCDCKTEIQDVTYGVIQVLRGDALAYSKQSQLVELQQAVQSLNAARISGLSVSAQAFAEVVKQKDFELNLKTVRLSPTFSKEAGKNVDDKEALLIILKKLAASINGGAPSEDAYSKSEVEGLRTALKVAFPNLSISSPMDAGDVYDRILTQLP
jgi:hypothetical protein